MPPESSSRRGELRRKLNLPGGFLFAYSGKLNKGKGLEMLLRVWRDVVRDRRDVSLLLIGSGAGHFISCERELRDFVSKEKLGGSVIFTGYVSNVWEYLQAVDSFVFPSEQESFALAPLEAMACGLPVVTTRVGELDKIVSETTGGILVEPGDEDGLKKALEQVLQNIADFKNRSAKARDIVVSSYGIDFIAEQHEKLFAGLLSGRERK